MLFAGFGLGPLLLVVLVASVVLFLLAGIRFIPNNKVGIVEMRISPKGSLDKGVIALNGEAGFQPKVLRGGLHYLLPIQFSVHIVPLVTIPQGKIGYVFARDGQLLPPSQALASNASADDFQDAVEFLRKGGQRGPQRKIIREGTYGLNLAEFVVITEERRRWIGQARHRLGPLDRLRRSKTQIWNRKCRWLDD